MSVTLKIDNFSSNNILETSTLAADSIVDALTMTLQSNQGFGANSLALIGTPGSEASDLAVVSGVSGSTIIQFADGQIKYPHSRFDRIATLFGDKIKIYRASNVNGTQPPDSSFAPFSGSLISIDPDQASTSFTDGAGDSTYWYKFTYYNTISTLETNLADSISIRGGGYATYCSVDDVRNEAGFNNAPKITDAMIDLKRKAAQEIINSALGGFYTVPFSMPVNPFIADITTRLAAGYLLLEQYGSFGTQNNQNGQSKVDKAMADIKWLQSGEGTLLDSTGTSISLPDPGGFTGWPNDDTPTTGQQYDGNNQPIAGSGDFGFRRDDRY